MYIRMWTLIKMYAQNDFFFVIDLCQHINFQWNEHINTNILSEWSAHWSMCGEYCWIFNMKLNWKNPFVQCPIWYCLVQNLLQYLELQKLWLLTAYSTHKIKTSVVVAIFFLHYFLMKRILFPIDWYEPWFSIMVCAFFEIKMWLSLSYWYRKHCHWVTYMKLVFLQLGRQQSFFYLFYRSFATFQDALSH